MSLSRTARRISLPALLAVVLAAALRAIAPGRATPAGASARAATAGAGHSAKPVIVLEHGAWADASSWSSVSEQVLDQFPSTGYGNQLSSTMQHGHHVVRDGAGPARSQAGRAADTRSRSALRPITGVSVSQRLRSRQEGGAEEHGVLQ